MMAFFLVLLIFVTNAHYFTVCHTHNYSSLIYVSIKCIIINIYCSMNKHSNEASNGGYVSKQLCGFLEISPST